MVKIAMAGFVLAMTVVQLGVVPEAQAARKKVVRIVTKPRNATIYVDSKEAGVKGYTPKNLRLRKGNHKIFIELEGYKPVEQFIEVKRRRETVVIKLEKLPAVAKFRFLADDPDHHDASVAVDGEIMGTIRDELKLKPGRHLIEISKDGYQKWTRWFDAGQGEKRDVEITLKPDVGKVKITSHPPAEEAFVFINDESKGPAPWSGELVPGRYKLEIRVAKYVSVPQVLLVESGSKSDVVIQLVKKGETHKIGELSVASDPALDEALVFIDGKNRGSAPWSGQVKAGHHKIEVRVPNYACDPSTQFVEGGKTTPVVIKLYPVAKLNVSTNVEKAEVFVDETSFGFTPLADVDIPAKRSTVYVRKEGYAEYSEVVFPETGENVSISPILEYSPDAGMKNYLVLKAIFGIFGWDQARITEQPEEITTGGELLPNAIRFGAALGYHRMINPYLGLGAQASFWYQGLGADMALDISPMLRLQAPVIRAGRRTVEFYLGLGGGFTMFFPIGGEGEDVLTDFQTDNLGASRGPMALGFNVLAPLGVQFNVSNFLGLYLEGGWQLHKVYGKHDSTDWKKYDYTWQDFFGAAGLAIIF